MEITIQENSQYGLVVSSRVVADELGKRHDAVLRDIRNILKNQSPQICGDLEKLIIPNTYIDSKKRTYKEYLLTKDGFTLYMFNIQGYIDFKMAYINKFNEMEKALANQKKQLPLELNYSNIIVDDLYYIEKNIRQLKAKANAIKKELLEKRFLIDEKIEMLDNTGLTSPMEIFRANGEIHVFQDM